MCKHYYITTVLLMPLLVQAQSKDSSIENWSGNVAAYYYYVPGNKIPPTITSFAEHNSLHLEARFDYEDINSVSFFAGHKFEKDKDDLKISITPMAGILVGRTDGILPGLEFEIDKSVFTLYSENEYLVSFAGKYGNFFYSWSELDAPVIKNKKLKLGLVAQTLRFYKTNFNIQKGVYAEYGKGKFLFDAYFFNPLSHYNFYTAAITYNF